MRNYLNIAIQLLNVIVALVPNLVYPLIFGLHYHGEFLVIIALPMFASFLVSLPFDNLLLKELAARKDLGLLPCINRLLWSKLALANLLFLAIMIFQSSSDILLQLAFINTAGISSFFLSALYADNRKKRIVVFLVGFTGLSLAAALIVYSLGLGPRILVGVVIFSNALGGAAVALLLKERWRGRGTIEIHPKRIFRFIGITSAIGTLSYGIVALAGGFLAPERLSLLRIAISVAQAATSFFPVNQRTILESAISLAKEGTEAVTRYLSAAFSLVALMAFGVGGAVLVLQLLSDTGLLPDFAANAFKQYRNEIVIIAPAVSLFLLASILEKVVIGLLSEARGLAFGIISTVLIVAGSITSMIYLPAGGFAAYTFSCLAIVGVALFMLGGKYIGITRPVLMLLAVIAINTLLSLWADIDVRIALAALLIAAISSSAFLMFLWKSKKQDILSFLKR